MAPASTATSVTTLSGRLLVGLVVGLFATCAALPTTADQRIVNISTRGQVLTGDDVLIGGFIIEGVGAKTVVLRARGPSLAEAGVTGVLANPNVSVYAGANLVDYNDDWATHERAGDIPPGLEPGHALEAAVVTTLDPGPYTAIVRGAGSETGIGIIEVFETNHTSRLVNLSTRGNTGTGDNVMIAGIIVEGDGPKTVALRAIGPSFANLPTPVPNELRDPQLTIFSGANTVDHNGNWLDHARAHDMPSRLMPSVNTEAAVVHTFEPGAYTAIVSGAGQTSGNALVEVYELTTADLDYDLDGHINSADPDDDNDGFADADDHHRLDQARAGDHDFDGEDSLTDTDDDNDGVPDLADSSPLHYVPTVTPGLIAQNAGHPMFASPHVRPIALAHGNVYVANTPADTVDVFSATTFGLVTRINVGIDPVTVAVRPDRRELWVSNHISDSISIIDIDPTSPHPHQVLHTIGQFDDEMATLFDEPTGIAFANDNKAYVALGPSNQIAIIEDRTITGHLAINAQDPRAIAVHDGRLYVLPFESNNQSQLSGCNLGVNPLDGDLCTYNAVQHAFTTNNVLSLNYDADIIKNPNLPDRDLYVYDTTTDQRIQVVNTLGTLLYGIAIDSTGKVYVTQTDARNTENGRAGTLKEGLEEMENRAFLNQITSVNCDPRCSTPNFVELEPLPPSHPAAGMALATPFGIKVTSDDQTLVVTAAGSDKLFTVDAASGAVVGRVDVGAVPRGVALENDTRAFVMNAVDNSVSVVDISDRTTPAVLGTITMIDPTHPEVRRGRAAFNDANASSTGTFSCESCHPDGGADQLLWVLDTPVCDIAGCTQIPPRLTMPVRGLRDTQPYHWDGIPGDPYGGNNTRRINGAEAPNCSVDDPASCTRFLVDGGLGSTMCDVANCPTNDEGKDGLLSAQERGDMATFLLSIPFPPAPRRPANNELTPLARDGIHEFNYVKDCGNCHKMPFLVSSNTPGTGMDAPTWRGAYDRWMILPQGRLNVIDLMTIVSMPNHFPEDRMWQLAGATPGIWQMVLQASTGFSGSFGRQVTLNETSANLASTSAMLDALILVAGEDGVLLQGEGLLLGEGNPVPVLLEYRNGMFESRTGGPAFSRQELVSHAGDGSLLLTLTGRIGTRSDVDAPQPALWQDVPIHQQTSNVNVPWLDENGQLRFKGRHILPGARLFLNGRRVGGTIACESGSLPNCVNEYVLIDLEDVPAGGRHLLQVQNKDGLYSNDALIYNNHAPVAARPGNLIASSGTFDAWDESWDTVELNGSISFQGNLRRLEIRASQPNTADPWRLQLSHRVWFVGGQTYTLCFRAQATAQRNIGVYTDIAEPPWTVTGQGSIRGGQYPVTIGTSWQQYSRTFTIAETDTSGRIAFDLAQHTATLYLDDVGVYEGTSCGTP